MPQPSTIFDDIKETEWKTPRTQSVFDDITSDEWQPESSIDFGKTLVEGAKDVFRNMANYLKEADAESWRTIYGDNVEAAQQRHEHEVSKDIIMRQVDANWLKPDGTLRRPDGFKGYVQDVVRMVPQIGAQTALTVAGGPVLGGSFMGTQIAGADIQDLKGKVKEPERAWKAALFDAFAQAPLEQIGLGKALKFWKPGKAAAGVIKAAVESGATEFLTEWIQQYPELAAKIWAKGEGKTPSQMFDEFTEGFWNATKEGMYQGAVAAPFGVVTGGAGSVLSNEQVPGITKDQVLSGLENKSITPDQAQQIKEAKPEYADIIDAALNEFNKSATPLPKEALAQQIPQPKSAQESAQVFETAGKPRAEQSYDVFEKAGLAGDPIELVKKRNQSIIDSVDLDILDEAEQLARQRQQDEQAKKTAELESAKQQESDINAEAAIADQTTARRRFDALSSIWDTLSEQEKDSAIKLIVPQRESSAIESERQAKAKAQTFNRTTPDQRTVEAQRKLKEADRLGLQLANRAELESEANYKPTKQEQVLKEAGRWVEPVGEQNAEGNGARTQDSRRENVAPGETQGQGQEEGNQRLRLRDNAENRVDTNGRKLTTEKPPAPPQAALPQIAEQFNTEYPGSALKYDGEQDRSAINKPPLQSFTFTEGPNKKKSFNLENPTVEAIKNKIAEMEQDAKDAKSLAEKQSSGSKTQESETKPTESTANETKQLNIGDTVQYNRGKYTIEELENGKALISNDRSEKIVNQSDLSEWAPRKRGNRKPKERITLSNFKGTLKNQTGSSQLITDVVNIFAKDQTKTKEFKNWFGKSVVVDEAGNPLVVYHGTTEDFDVFDKRKSQDFGIHFGNSDQASEFSNKSSGRTIPVYLSIKNPLELDFDPTVVDPNSDYHAEGKYHQELLKQIAYEMGHNDLYQLYRDGNKNAIAVIDASEKADELARELSDNDDLRDLFGSEKVKKFHVALGEFISSEGYDGVIYENEIEGSGGISYSVFDPTQIKSAIGNTGAFDPNNPSIIGSSQMITDIANYGANLIQKGIDSFRQFRSAMREKFSDIWNKIREHMRSLWNVLNNKRGEIKIERQESVDDLISKLQSKEPKKEVVQHDLGDGWYQKISALERPINDLTAWLADKNHPISVIQRRLNNVTERIDVFLRETQRPKVTAAKIQRMWTDEVEPLLKDMANSNITLGDLEEYAHAFHAPEANQKLSDAMAKTYLDNILNSVSKEQSKQLRAEIEKQKEKRISDMVKKANQGGPLNYRGNLIPGDYRKFLDAAFNLLGDNDKVKNIKSQWDKFSEKPSGMTDNEAAAIRSKWKSNKDIERLRLRLKSINANRLDTLYDAGLIAKEEYEAIKAKYKEYVPLYREGYDDSLFGPSRGLRPSGRPIKTRMGSNRNVVNILAHSIANYEKAINLAEKARSTEALKNLVIENPNPELWVLKKEKKSPRHDKYGNIRMYPDLFNVARNEMRFMVGGKQWILEVNKDNKDAMNMLKTLKAEDTMHGWALNQLARLNRFLARVNTSWSPEFILSNFVRDLQTAGINIKDTGVKSKTMIRGALKSANAIWHVERGKQKGTQLEKLYERFKDAGGKIGWADVHQSVENLSKKLSKEIETLAGKRPTRATIKKWGDFIESGNTAIENGVRLHAFQLATEQGFSDAKAAQIASDLTVDFTKKGYAGPAINSLYLFANAGIQGSYRILRAASKSSKVRKTMVAIMGMGFLNGILNSMAGGTDEDNEDYFNKIEDYVKERNAIFMLPGTKGKYVKIPLPWGYNLPWAVGVELSRSLTQINYKPTEGAMRLGSTFFNSFNPIQSGTLLQTLSPTIADPFVQVAENKNWYGGPLMPDQNQFDKVPKPDSQRYWKTARAGSKIIAQGLNAATGGDKVKPGFIDVSPETLDLALDTMGGSAARFFADIGSLPMSWTRGEEPKIKQYPFLRRIAGEQSGYVNSQAYFKNVQDILTAKKQLETYQGTKYYKGLFDSTEPQRKMFGMVKSAESALRKLRKSKRAAEAHNNKQMVDKIEKRIEAIYIKFNKAYNEKE